MINALIALAVIVMFALGLPRALRADRRNEAPEAPQR
jgi:hypothetical protein